MKSQWVFVPHAHKSYAGDAMRAVFDEVLSWKKIKRIVGFSTNHYRSDNVPAPNEHSWKFVQEVLSEYTDVLPEVTFYSTPNYSFRDFIEDDCLYICNSDLVHTEESEKFAMLEAEKTIKYMSFYDVDHGLGPSDTACGVAAMETFRYFMRVSGIEFWPKLMSYYLSPGPRYVGYASIIFRVRKPVIYHLFSDCEKGILREYARRLVRSPTVDSPDFLWIGHAVEYGLFPTLYDSDGNLRGCVGSLDYKNLSIIEKIRNFVPKSLFEDSRFVGNHLSRNDDFSMILGILDAGKETTIESWKYEPGMHGVSLVVSGISAFFLPEVTLHYDKMHLLSELCRKMGKDGQCYLNPDHMVILYEGIEF